MSWNSGSGVLVVFNNIIALILTSHNWLAEMGCDTNNDVKDYINDLKLKQSKCKETQLPNAMKYIFKLQF